MKFSSQKQQKLCSCNGLHGFHNFFFLFLSFLSFYISLLLPSHRSALSSSDTHVTRASLNSRPCFIFVSVFIIDFSLSHTAGSCRALFFACLFVMEWFAFLYAKNEWEFIYEEKRTGARDDRTIPRAQSRTILSRIHRTHGGRKGWNWYAQQVRHRARLSCVSKKTVFGGSWMHTRRCGEFFSRIFTQLGGKKSREIENVIALNSQFCYHEMKKRLFGLRWFVHAIRWEISSDDSWGDSKSQRAHSSQLDLISQTC